MLRTENNGVFCAACAMSFLLNLQWGMVTTHLPIYVHELGGSPLEVALIFTVFAGLISFTQPVWGFISDHLGKRKVFMVLGMFGLTPILLLISTQTNTMPLIVLRGSTAIFVGATVPATLALISDISPGKMMGKNLGINSLFDTAGFAVGPIIGGVIADLYGFARLWIFVAGICFAGGSTIPISWFRPAQSEEKPRRATRPRILQSR